MTGAVFFDWFNTLAQYDPPREAAHAAVCREFGVQVDPEQLAEPLAAADRWFYEENVRSPVFRRPPKEQAELFLKYELGLLAKLGLNVPPETALKIVQKSMAQQRMPKFVLFDDVLPTLQALKQRNLVLGLISNVPFDIQPICEKLGLGSYLNFVVTSQEAGADKPDPAIFRAALRKGKVEAAGTIYVGDQYSTDVVGARGAGLKPVLLDRNNRHAEVTDCPRIASLKEVVGLL